MPRTAAILLAFYLTVAQEQGGHYATESLAARLGYQVHTITGPDPHTIDFEGLETSLRTVRPTLVYVDQSNCLFPLDVERLVGPGY
jgi:glycine/serine hydroxymethyltransferase